MMEFPFMKLALEEATLAGKRDEVPVGAVVVSPSGAVIARAGNRVEETNDPTAHAEIVAIREACKILGTTKLSDCDLHVTLEPCAMCAQAISFARIRRVYFAASDPKMGGVEHGARVFNSSSCHHKPEVYSGMMAEPAVTLMKEFFKERR